MQCCGELLQQLGRLWQLQGRNKNDAQPWTQQPPYPYFSSIVERKYIEPGFPGSFLVACQLTCALYKDLQDTESKDAQSVA